MLTPSQADLMCCTDIYMNSGCSSVLYSLGALYSSDSLIVSLHKLSPPPNIEMTKTTYPTALFHFNRYINLLK